VFGSTPFGAQPYAASVLGATPIQPAQSYGGATDQDDPPPGYRRLLDTSGINLRELEEKRLQQARREIGLLQGDEVPLLPAPIAAVPLAERIAFAELPVIQIPELLRDMYAEEIAAALLAAIRADDAAELARIEQARAARLLRINRDDADVLLLLSALI
jgi:hypothetical protein